MARGKGGIKFHAIVGSFWVVGGPGSTCQDSVSLSMTPKDSFEQIVKIDRFQIRLGSRGLGIGTRVLQKIVQIYKAAGAMALVVPAATTGGASFYKKCGFQKGPIESLRYDLQGCGLGPLFVGFLH